MTKAELDERLARVVHPAPIISAGPWHPISTYEGYGDPWPEWYRGARIVRVDGLADRLVVREFDPVQNKWLEG
jgi:hypothetical protein